MANRILVATLFPGQNGNPNLMTVSPNNIQLAEGDVLYLLVKESTPNSKPAPISGGLIISNITPFGDSKEVRIPNGAVLGTPVQLGTIKGSKNKSYSYSVTITCSGKTYSEDPEMQIKP